MEDKPIPPVVEEEQTSIIAGKAEPGRDIFADNPAKDIQSQSVLVTDTAPAVEKEISTVIVQQTTSVSESAIDRTETKGESSSQSTKDVEPGENIETSESENESKPAAGPLDEAEAEAERAAHELFPDA